MAKPERHERRIIIAALFVALSVVLGYLFAAVPNVELMTLSVFLGGIFLGVRLGIVIGMLSILIFSLFNPYGPPLPPLALAQVFGYGLIGLAGGVLGGRLSCGRKEAVIVSAAAGLILTLMYDFLTTCASAVIVLGLEGFISGVQGFFAAGLLFVILHTVSNTVIFAVTVVPVVGVVSAWERRRA